MGEKRRDDVIGNAVREMRIATRERDEEYDTPTCVGRDQTAVAMGKKGGTAQAAKLWPDERAEIARKAAAKL